MKQHLKKLLFTKHFVDSPSGETIAEWRLSPWKVFFLLIATLIGLILVYSYLQPNPQRTLGDIVFYAIVLVSAIAVLWAVASTVIKFRKLLAGFFLAFILILTFYWVLGAILSHFGILEFHLGGYALWVLITILAGLGAKRIDGNLDRNDVGFGLLVFVILLGANIPLNQHGGFLANIDHFIETIKGWLTFQGLQRL